MTESAKLPLVVRKNIRDEFDNKKPALIAKIKESLQMDDELEFVVDWAAIHSAILASNKKGEEHTYQKRLGEVTYWYYSALADSIGRNCDEDDMVRETITESIQSSK